MNVFLSWSGAKSKAVAQALRDWLPNVIQAVTPWMSAEDLAAGTRWSSEITQNLEKTSVGIICLTPDNLTKPWILFEAGALSKMVAENLVVPYLFDIQPADVQWPLAMFQSARADQEGTRILLGTINHALGEAVLPEQRLDEIFSVWWPRLEAQLKAIPPATVQPKSRSDRELLEELLELTRSQTIRTDRTEVERATAVEDVNSRRERQFQHVDDQGRRYRTTSLTTAGFRSDYQFAWRGFLPPDGRSWNLDAARLDQLADEGFISFPEDSNGVPSRKQYLDGGPDTEKEKRPSPLLPSRF